MGPEAAQRDSNDINGPEVVAILEVVDDFLACVKFWEMESKGWIIGGVADTSSLDCLGGASLGGA